MGTKLHKSLKLKSLNINENKYLAKTKFSTYLPMYLPKRKGNKVRFRKLET